MRRVLSDMTILQQLNPNERCHYRFDLVLYYLARNLSHANAIAKDQSRPFGHRHFRRSLFLWYFVLINVAVYRSISLAPGTTVTQDFWVNYSGSYRLGLWQTGKFTTENSNVYWVSTTRMA